MAPATRCYQSSRPAARHIGDFDDETLPMPPNFNEGNVSDKPRIVRSRPRINPEGIATLQQDWRCRMETVLGADDGVGEVLDALEASGESDNTLVVFHSDNGFLSGQHRYQHAKRHPYEEAIRVPLLMRGPGIAPDTRVRELAFNTDLAATILDATGAEPSVPQDGRSLLPSASRPEVRNGRDLLIRGPGWMGVRNHSFTFVRRDGSAGGGTELYDLKRDPFQLESLDEARRFADERRALRKRLRVLRNCAGRSCTRPPAVRLRVMPYRCRSRRVRVRAAGGDRDALARVRFERDGKRLRTARRKPFQVRVRRVDVKRITARATMIDGRLVTLAAAGRRACGLR